MRLHFINTLLAATSKQHDFMVLSGDAGLGVFDELKQDRPEMFLNMGVAEQNMTCFAAGMALTGYKVLLYNIVPFLLYRCYEQVRNSLCYMNLPVILTGIGCGLTYAPAGMTHYSVEDLGIARTLPNLTVLSPCDPLEAVAAAEYALAADNPVYVRIAKSGEPNLHHTRPDDISQPLVLRSGQELAILVHGPIALEALTAADLMVSKGYQVRVISIPLVQPLAVAALADALKDIRTALVVEEHFSNCGLGARILELAGSGQLSVTVKAIGIPADQFIHQICKVPTLRARFGIDAAGIVQALLQLTRSE